MDSYCKKILVNESEKRIYTLYTSLKYKSGISNYAFLTGPYPTTPISIRSEVLVVYDSENFEHLNTIHSENIVDICINELTSELYLVNPDELRLMVLDKNGFTLQRGILTKYGDILVSSETSQGDILPPRRSPIEFGLGVNIHLRRLYFAMNGRNANYLLTYNIDEIF